MMIVDVMLRIVDRLLGWQEARAAQRAQHESTTRRELRAELQRRARERGKP